MNQLTHISITGHIRLGFASLHMAYRFEAPAQGVSSARYFFPMPQDAILCSLQVLNGQGQMLRAIVRGASEELPDGGVQLNKVKEGLFCLQWHGQETPFQVLLQVLLPLQRGLDAHRLIFPTGFDARGTEAPMPPSRVSMQLEATGDYTFISRRHEIAVSQLESNLQVTADFFSGEDFVLEIKEKEPRAQGLARLTWQDYTALYRIGPLAFSEPDAPTEPVLLLMDATGSDQKALSLLKDAIFRTYQAMPKNLLLQVQMLGDAPVFDAPQHPTEAQEEALFAFLSAYTPQGGTRPPTASGQILLFSNGSGQIPLSKEGRLWHITVGNNQPTAVSPTANTWHLYPEDLQAERLALLLNALWAHSPCPRIQAEDAAVKDLQILAYDGNFLTVAAKGSGALPRAFRLVDACGTSKVYAVTEMQTMEHFPMAERVYAAGKLKQLTALLAQSNAASLRAIKQEMEDLCVNYGILSQESVLTVPCGGTEGHLKTNLFLQNIPTERQTIFGERGKTTCQAKEAALLAYLLSMVRSDGAICMPASMGQAKIDQTAWAALALSAYQEYAPVVKDAQAFLSGKPQPADLSLTCAIPMGWDVISVAKQLLSKRKA